MQNQPLNKPADCWMPPWFWDIEYIEQELAKNQQVQGSRYPQITIALQKLAARHGWYYSEGNNGTLPNRMAGTLLDLMLPGRGVASRQSAFAESLAGTSSGCLNDAYCLWGKTGRQDSLGNKMPFCLAYLQWNGFLFYLKLNRPVLHRLEVVSRKWTFLLKLLYPYKRDKKYEWTSFNKHFRVLTDKKTVEGSEARQVVEPVTMDRLVRLSGIFGNHMRALFEKDELLICFPGGKRNPLLQAVENHPGNQNAQQQELETLVDTVLASLMDMESAWN